MRSAFTKMHGLGNDFMVVAADGLPVPGPERIRQLADRHTGIGFDQLLWLEPPRDRRADIRYRIFNSDGSESEQCGNGARCIARYLAPDAADGELKLEHGLGISRARLLADGEVSVDMGAPDFDPASLPFVTDAPAESYRLDIDGEAVEFRVVSMGNPHAVLLVDDVDSAPVAGVGPALQNHERFPNRANIGFMQVVAPGHARLRVFERGAGETSGCGTGACAAAVVGQRAGLLDSTVRIQLPGGPVTVSWQGADEPVWLTGEAVTVFEGNIDI
jgi:diaminopimelate epimerase